VIALNEGKLVIQGPPSAIDEAMFKDIYGQEAERVG
jgi:ABC-type phosphate/phosphonate transport system ATPase subunit